MCFTVAVGMTISMQVEIMCRNGIYETVFEGEIWVGEIKSWELSAYFKPRRWAIFLGNEYILSR